MSKLEAVLTAILDEFEAQDAYVNRSYGLKECTVDGSGIDMFRVAHKAIEALRTPTPEMVKAGCEEYAEGDENQYPVENGISDAWDAMIDEILKDA